MFFLALFWWFFLLLLNTLNNLTNWDILTLISSDFRSQALKLSEHLKKFTIYVFIFIWPLPTLRSFFTHFLFNFFCIFIFHNKNLHYIYVSNTIFHISMTVIKEVKHLIFQESLTSMKPTGCCFLLLCLFHSQDPKPKRNHQTVSSRTKTRSRQSQTCVTYRGNIICNKRNTDVNTRSLKKLPKKTSK